MYNILLSVFIFLSPIAHNDAVDVITKTSHPVILKDKDTTSYIHITLKKKSLFIL